MAKNRSKDEVEFLGEKFFCNLKNLTGWKMQMDLWKKSQYREFREWGQDMDWYFRFLDCYFWLQISNKGFLIRDSKMGRAGVKILSGQKFFRT